MILYGFKCVDFKKYTHTYTHTHTHTHAHTHTHTHTHTELKFYLKSRSLRGILLEV